MTLLKVHFLCVNCFFLSFCGIVKGNSQGIKFSPKSQGEFLVVYTILTIKKYKMARKCQKRML